MLKDKLDLLASARGFMVVKEMDNYTVESKGRDFVARIYEDGTINFYVKQEDDEGFLVLKSIDADELEELRRFCERLNKEEI